MSEDSRLADRAKLRYLLNEALYNMYCAGASRLHKELTHESETLMWIHSGINQNGESTLTALSREQIARAKTFLDLSRRNELETLLSRVGGLV